MNKKSETSGRYLSRLLANSYELTMYRIERLLLQIFTGTPDH